MQKTIILGTDLHGNPTELASKTVNNIKKSFKDYKILSIEHRKERTEQEDIIIIPKISKNSRIRRIFQALSLPFYLSFSRIAGHNELRTFWVANSYYHSLLFKFLKLIRYKIIFTIISGEDTNLNAIKDCDVIICQSNEMLEKAKKRFPKKEVNLVYPRANLNLFKPSKKDIDIVIPSVPYSVNDFDQRGINEMLDFIKDNTFKVVMIFRSKEPYNFVKSKNIKNLTLINKDLSDKELSNILSKARIMPLIYKNSPDMPLSAIEGLSSGCAIICTYKMGLSKIIEKNKAGIVIKDFSELRGAINKILSNPEYNKNARKTAEKIFS